MRGLPSIAVVVLSFAEMIGCGSSTPAQNPNDADSDAASEASVRVTASGQAIRNSDGTPIANARACILDHPEIQCATSDTTGTYTIELPDFGAGLDVAGNVTAAGFLGDTELIHERLPGVRWVSGPLRDTAEATTLLSTQAGFTYPASGKGYVLLAVFHAAGGGYVGQKVAVSPASGQGPVYLDPTGVPDPALTAVTTDGYVLFGGLAPGKIEITATGAPCTVEPTDTLMWASAKPHTIAGEIAADSITRMSLICQE